MERVKLSDTLEFSRLIYGMWRLGDDSDTSAPKPTVLPVGVVKVRTQTGFLFPVTFYGRIQAARRNMIGQSAIPSNSIGRADTRRANVAGR